MAYVTAGSRNEALKIARALLKQKLIACANIHRANSLYWWRGEIAASNEFILVCKTLRKKRRQIIKSVKEIHSYETPCVVFTKVAGGSLEYLQWIRKNVDPA